MINNLPLHRLKLINLDHCFAIRPSTILSLLSLQHNTTTLQVLCLNSCDLVESIESTPRRAPTVTRNNPIVNQILDKIKEFKGLKVLDLTGTCGIGEWEVRYLFLDERGEGVEEEEDETKPATESDTPQLRPSPFPNLRELGLYPSAFTADIIEAVGSRLKKMAIRRDRGRQGSPLGAAFQVGKESLRELTVYGHCFWEQPEILQAALPCENLRVLILLTETFHYETLPMVIENLPQLEFLEVSGTPTTYRKVKCRSASLKVLSIVGDGVRAVGYFYIKCPQLHTVLLKAAQTFFGDLK